LINKTYNDKLKELFQSNCEELIIATEGTLWSKWINPKTINDNNILKKLLEYYGKIYTFINKLLNESNKMKLPGDDKPIQIVHDILLRYRYNQNDKLFYMFDIEMILYREGKLQGKHIKFFVVTNGERVNIILSRIIGVVSEDHIIIHPYNGVDLVNNVDFAVFTPITKCFCKY